MLSKQISSLLLAVALPLLTHALLLDTDVNGPAEQSLASSEPGEVACNTNPALRPAHGSCKGPIFYCEPLSTLGNISPGMDASVECGPGYWTPWRGWMHDEAMDYMLKSIMPPH